MEPISTALLAIALFETGKKLAEKAIIDPALEKGLEPFKKWLTSSYDTKKAEEELRSVLLYAWDELQTQIEDKFERLKIVQSVTGLSPDTHKILAATALEMVRNEPSKVPITLLNELKLDNSDREWLARYLVILRKHLATYEQFIPLIKFANDLDKANLLSRLSADVAQITLDSHRIKTLLELLAAERHLTDNDKLALDEYIANCRKDLATLALPFIRQGPAGSASAQLNKVFVPLYVRDEKAEQVARRKAEKRQREELDLKNMDEDVRPIDFNDLFARYERFILIGLPGTGKTTLLRRAALAFAEGRAAEDLAWKGHALLPIFVRLRNFGTFLANNKALYSEPSHGALVAYLENQSKIDRRQSLPPDFFDRRLNEGSCLVLLDGLDEVTENREEIAQYIQKFIQEYGKNGNRIGLSSRPKGYDEDVRIRLKAADLALADVTPLQPNGIRQLMKNLLLMDDEGQRKYKDDPNRLSNRVLGNPKLTEIAAVPLFCSALVQVYKYHGGIDLPQRRVDVLAEIADLLLGFWHAQKEVAQSESLAQDDGTGQLFDGTKESVEYKRNRLAHLAYKMQTELKSAEISKKQGIKELALYLEQNEGVAAADARRWAKGFLRNSHERSGVLVETSANVYAFIHKNFMEYFAATALIKDVDDPIQAVLDILDEDPTWWDEMIAFAGAHPLGVQLHKKWTPRILAAAAQLSLGSEGWLRRLTVAGIMARDMTTRLPHPQRLEIQNALYTAATNTNLRPTDRATLADLLEETGYQPDDLYSFVEISDVDHSFFMAKYPVTNAQYARFLTPENFANKDLWTGFIKNDKNSIKMPDKNWEDEPWDWLQKKLKIKDNFIENGTLLPRSWRDPQFGQMRPGAPVVDVSWYEANAYCKWLALQTDFPEALSLSSLSSSLHFPTSSFRLPTEAEWVQASGDGEKKRFAFGQLKNDLEIIRFANTWESSIDHTTPVWMYPQGASYPYKIFDLSGNIWEWLHNSDDSYQYKLRGGSWRYTRPAAYISLHWDEERHRTITMNEIGFRVVFIPSN